MNLKNKRILLKKIFLSLFISLTLTVIFSYYIFSILNKESKNTYYAIIKPMLIMTVSEFDRAITEENIIDHAVFIDNFTLKLSSSKNCGSKIISNKKILFTDYYLGIKKDNAENILIRFQVKEKYCLDFIRSIIKDTIYLVLNRKLDKLNIIINDERIKNDRKTMFYFFQGQIEKLKINVENFFSVEKDQSDLISKSKIFVSLLLFLFFFILVIFFSFFKDFFKILKKLK